MLITLQTLPEIDWVWPNFPPSELECHCDKAEAPGKTPGFRYDRCEVLKVDTRLLDFLQGLRTAINRPISLSCAYRCERHNAAVGGKPASQHLLGLAADIQRGSLPPQFLTVLDVLLGDQGGLGAYEWGFHIDIRGHRARW